MLAIWVWGGYSVGNPTLGRFYSLHFLLPFIVAALALLHLLFLHVEGSSEPLGITHGDYIPFYPYFF